MPSPLFDIYGGQQNARAQIQQEVEMLKKRFAPNTDPRQIVQQMLNSGEVSQAEYNAAYNQARLMRGK